MPKKFDIDLLQFGITNICNNNCIMCHQSQDWYIPGKTGFMSFSHAKKIIDNIYENNIKFKVIHTFWKGEPFLAPDFMDILEYLFKKNNENLLFEKLYINTNGTVLKGKEEKLLQILNMSKEIRTTLNFSIDANSDETYTSIRRSKFFPDIEHSIRTILKIRNEKKYKDPVIIFQIVVMKENFHDIDGFVQKWKNELSKYSLMAEYMYYLKSIDKDTIFFRPLQPETEKSRALWMNVLKKYLPEEHDKINDIHIKRIHANKISRPDKPCYHLWTTPVIGWDGKVTACCSDFYIDLLKDADIDFQNDDFTRIWFGPEMEELRRKSYFLEYNDMPDVCKNCIMYLEMNEEFKMLLSEWAIERGYPVLYSSDIEFCNETDDLINIANKMMKNKEFDKVYNILNRALMLDKDNDKIYEAFLTFYSKTGKYKEALNIALRLSKQKKDYRFYDEIAFFYENLKDFSTAFKYYKKALKIKKDKYYIVKMIDMLHKDGSFKNIEFFFRIFKIANYKTDEDIVERMIDLYFIHSSIGKTDVFKKYYNDILFFIKRDNLNLKEDFVHKVFYLKREINIKGDILYFTDFIKNNIEYL
ncbi:MAG: radical SAM protein, partial [Candidatus Muirbacterium halophilum]|nr:radical SAM protein [Candidatus Muirbacterium halophilum]